MNLHHENYKDNNYEYNSWDERKHFNANDGETLLNFVRQIGSQVGLIYKRGRKGKKKLVNWVTTIEEWTCINKN